MNGHVEAAQPVAEHDGISRRNLLAISSAGAALLACGPRPADAPTNATGGSGMQLTQDWDKKFPKSNRVDHRKVTFKNWFGITLAGDLYLPKDRADRRLTALAVSGPFGAVKEQSSGFTPRPWRSAASSR